MRTFQRGMQSGLLLALFLTVLTYPIARLAAAEPAQPGEQKPAALDRTIKLTTKYLIYLPKDYEQKSSWPLMLFLHGAGERGDDLEKIKKHGPPKLIAAGKEFPFIVVSPQCPSYTSSWNPVFLSALLDEIEQKYKVDKDRVYLTGLSMGGFGTWALAAYEPDRFAALMPICGGADKDNAKLLVDVPIWVFHGAKDPANPIKGNQEMVDALKKLGSKVKFTVYPDGVHDVWTETYNNPEVFKWLLEQKRTPKKAETNHAR